MFLCSWSAHSPCLCVQDCGYPQSTATETLKSYIYNEPETVEKSVAPRKKSVSKGCVAKAYSSVGWRGIRYSYAYCRLLSRKHRIPFQALPQKDQYQPLWMWRYATVQCSGDIFWPGTCADIAMWASVDCSEWFLCLAWPVHVVFSQRKPGSHSEVFVDLLEKLTVVVSATVRIPGRRRMSECANEVSFLFGMWH